MSSRRKSGPRRCCRRPAFVDDDLSPSPRKRRTRKNCRKRNILVTETIDLSSTESPQVLNTHQKTKVTPTETVDLTSAGAAERLKNVQSTVVSFMRSGNFISSDEDDDECKSVTRKRCAANNFHISDDSDDEVKVVKTESRALIPTIGVAGCSTSSTNITERGLDDDIMALVDSILDKPDSSKRQSLDEVKSLEDYRKETEEMLKNANNLYEEIAGKKTQPEPKKEHSPKVTIGGCPVCLESLANIPAATTLCGHIFCKECITQAAQTLKKCPTCRKTISVKKIHPIYL